MSVFSTVIGWVAPPYCVGCGLEGSALCEACSAAEIIPYGEKCWRCGALSLRAKTCEHCRHVGAPNHVWVTAEYNSAAKELVRIYKFQHQRAAAEPLAALMVETFLASNSDETIRRKNYLLIPVPTASSRIRERSFDHTALLARKTAVKLGLEMGAPLARWGQSSQIGSKREQRLSQLQGKFYIKNPKRIKGRNIILLDDVITTGGTMAAAAKTLRTGGARSVDALVFAKKL